jgi:hypothetical protein
MELAIRTAGANASDHRQIIPAVLDSPRIKSTPGRPKERPDDLDADRGDDREGTSIVDPRFRTTRLVILEGN